MTQPQEPNFSMLELFCHDLQEHASALQEVLLLLKKDRALSAYADSLVDTFHQIAGGARLLHLKIIDDLASALEEFFNRAKVAGIEADDKSLLLIEATFKLFISASSIAPADFTKWLAEQSVAFEDSEKRVKERVSSLGPAEKVEVKEVEPKAAPPEEKPAVETDTSMLELFHAELEEHLKVFNEKLLFLEENPRDAETLEALMRAAHSVKGAARVVALGDLSDLAHVMEDSFVAAQHGQIHLTAKHLDCFFVAVDALEELKNQELHAMASWVTSEGDRLKRLIALIAPLAEGKAPPESVEEFKAGAPVEEEEKVEAEVSEKRAERAVRVSTENLEQLLGLAGQSLVEARWLQPFSSRLLAIKREQNQLTHLVDELRESLEGVFSNSELRDLLVTIQQKSHDCRTMLSERLGELDEYIRRHDTLSDNLYHQVIASRMRPFRDGVQGYPRMVRDLARQLGKEVQLVVDGEDTPVDRDILEKLESPLTHLIRNAIDHGIDTPDAREKAGKSRQGTITIKARHRAGMLHLTLKDDGRGINIESVRRAVVRRKLNTEEVAAHLTDMELMEFLFLPGFTTSEKVTDVSGRGVGLDVVRATIQEIGGRVRAETQPGKGLTFTMQLPLTLSVIRALTVAIAGEPYAFPLTRIHGVALVLHDDIETIEGRQFFSHEEQNIGLVPAHQVLRKPPVSMPGRVVKTIILKDRMNVYGLAVDDFLGDKQLVVQELDPGLGKVPNIAAGALMEDGSPILIMDVEDLTQSIVKILERERLQKVEGGAEVAVEGRKRVLVVDDSATVREVETRLLEAQGYEVDVAVDGMDGWNAVRQADYDLVITDIDMPRMDGIELVRRIRADELLKDMPIMIVSYKDLETERRAGLEAGANAYFTKSGFQDESLIHAVEELIGGGS